MDAERRRELADFVRAQREMLAPAAAGLPAGGRRRTPGLRREEVAHLSGLSVTWYTWIEQARDVSISPAALSRLASGLRLHRSARAYLFQLAGRHDPDPDAQAVADLPAVLRAFVQRVDAPAYVLDRGWNARCWNGAADHLFAGWLDRPGDRNLLRFIFLDPSARTLICDWELRARRVTAEFRASGSAFLNDPALRTLIDTLHRESGDFARFWDQHSVLGREGGLRTFNHPTDGYLRFEQVTFDLASQPDLKLTVLVPQG